MQNEDTLTLIRMAQREGIINKFTPAERAKLRTMAGPAMESELKDALEPPRAQGTKSTSDKWIAFSDSAINSVVSGVKRPDLAALEVARGIERSFVGDSLETLESIAGFPIIRGAELAARLFVPKDQRPDLTRFSQVVSDQIKLSDQLQSVVPGWSDASEMWAYLESGRSLFQLGSKIFKTGLSLTRASIQRRALLRAERESSKLTKKMAEVLRLGEEDTLATAIARDPEQIAQMVKEGKVSADNIAIQLRDDLSYIETKLGERVGAFRDKAFADDRTRLKIPQTVGELFDAVRSRTTVRENALGKALPDELYNAIPSKLRGRFMKAERAAKMGVTTPNQALSWVDVLDEVIEFGRTDKSNAINSANSALLSLRNELKNLVRTSSGQGKTWAMADDAFHQFTNHASQIITTLDSTHAEAFVANLLNKNKTPIQRNLSKALDYMDQVDPTAGGYGEAFYRRLQNLKAAEHVRNIKYPPPGNRVGQEGVHEIIRRWTMYGQSVGSSVGTVVGWPVGHIALTGVGPWGAPSGGAAGAYVGSQIGKLVGVSIGKRMADPMRVLDTAMKAKTLSKEAKALASDLQYLVKVAGPEASIAFFDLVGPIPAVRELVYWANGQANNK